MKWQNYPEKEFWDWTTDPKNRALFERFIHEADLKYERLSNEDLLLVYQGAKLIKSTQSGKLEIEAELAKRGLSG